MKKLTVLIFISLFLTAGCTKYNFGRTEINKILFVNAVGIDKAEDGSDDIIVSSATKNIKPASGSIGESSDSKTKANILTSRGATNAEAIRNLSAFSDKRVFYGHAEYILVGENAAKDDMLKYIDLFNRDHEIRLNSKVLIVKGNTALCALREIGNEDIFVGDLLESLLSNKDKLSISDEIHIVDTMNMFDYPYMSPYIPCIEIVSGNYEDSGEQSNIDRLKLSGFALFKGEKLFGYITDRMARGFNWVRGKIRSGIIVVKEPGGQSVSLEITESKTKIIPKLTGGKLSIAINIRLSTNVISIKGTKNIFKKDILDYLENQQEETVKKEAEDILSFAKENNMDIFPISYEVYRKYPVLWESIKNDWNKIFPDLKISVNIDSVINRTYDIEEPIRSGYGVEK
ncbi:Ger(x)C family spore germination protein [Lutispora saccharofermentans]|uniref:Ger(X)C family spore germination protein n=1 Tax=Lutispora saccharofermentans TaxID=3024236 RepID=A0ABT1NG72_9FIRM|nr:Ger(x)C family spore germination protein [Lutispora saccharofermentans]MCQ1530156.1 Ger(x)C family spore germination protein [Lutispora saccharofermentans]